jgi:eukaryotic-like serine/threonine-protein kinase
MTARWVLVEQLFHEAVDLSPEARATFLGEACAEDKELYREIESLLACSDATLSELTEPVQVTAGEMIRGGRQGQCIGPYRLIRLVGHGGMGVVFLAERVDGQYSRQVAIKLMSAALSGSPAMLIRFRAERQILARLEHPNIARLLDGGMTEDGQPYLVIEYVDGEPLNEYCSRVQPSLSARLQLFLEICAAVEYAHRYLVIHRDLKPANIFVTADGQPKLLDFGLARLLDPSILGLSGAHTRASERLLTPEYASPEQIRGEAISTTTDVFGLGILLYELLAGRRPFQVENSDPMALARAVCEQESPPPSSIAKGVPGDLDHIVMMALRKEPERRYTTAAQLSADIRAFLNGLPVAARTGSFRYRSAKFVRRHKTAVAAAVIFLLTLAGFSGAMAMFARRAQRQAIIARQSEQTAQAINDFLQNDLLAQASTDSQAEPGAKPDPHLEVRTALDRAAARLTGKFDRQPEVEAGIRDTIGQTYRDLGLYAAARMQLERAVALYRRVLGVENPKTLRTMSRLAFAIFNLGQYAQAEVLFNRTLEIQRRLLGYDHPDTLYSMNGLADVWMQLGKYAQAEALHKQTLEIRRRVLGPENRSTVLSMYNLAIVYVAQGRYAEAEALCKHVVDVDRRNLGPDHQNTQGAMHELAIIYNSQGKYAQAEELTSETLAIRRRVLGPEHPETLISMGLLAQSLLYEGKYPKAEALSSQFVELERRVNGPQNVYTLLAMDYLADSYSLQSKFGQAEALFGSLLEVSRRVLGPEHPDTVGFLSDVADMYQRRWKYALAEVYAAQALAGQRHALGSEHPDTMTAAADLALAYQSQQKFAQSETLAREAWEFYRKKQPDDWKRFRAESLLGASLSGQKRYAEAEPLLLEGYQGMLSRKERIAADQFPGWYHLDRAREWIRELYRAWGKPTKAAEWRQKG